MSDERIELIRERIRDVPDFPKPGIMFKDITPLLADPVAFRVCIHTLADKLTPFDLDAVAGIESRGFIFGAALAERLGCSFVPVRKPGKLPYKTKRAEYALEYGTDAVEVHVDAFPKGAKVGIVDDLIATGGTAAATAELVEACGATVAVYAFVIDLTFLNGAAKLGDVPIIKLIDY